MYLGQEKEIFLSVRNGAFMCKVKKIYRVLLQCVITLIFFCMSVSRIKAAGNGQTEIDVEQPIEDGMYKVVSSIDNEYVWDIANAATEDGGNLQLYTSNNSDAQKFTFTYLSDGYYFITNVNSSKAIECSGEGAASSVNIQQSSFKNTDVQCWKLTSTGDDYYTLTCKANGLAADAAGGIAKDGTNMQVYQLNNTPAQEFRLVRIIGDEAASGSYLVAEDHSKGFYYIVCFLILGVGAAVIIGIGHFYQKKKNKK